MSQLLNLVGGACAAVVFLMAMRVFAVGMRGEVSLRSGLALCGALAGGWPIAHVIAGGQLAPSHVLLLVVVAGLIIYHLRAAVAHHARRATDFAEFR